MGRLSWAEVLAVWVYFLQHVEQRLGVPGNAEPQLGASILPHKLPKISASPPPSHLITPIAAGAKE